MRRRNKTPDTKPSRRPYQKVGFDDNDKQSWRRWTNVFFILLFVVTVVVVVSFGIALGEWVRDGTAQKMVDAAQEMLRIATISILQSRQISQDATQQKALTIQLQTQASDLKGRNQNQTNRIGEIDVAATVSLDAQINETLFSLGDQVTLQIKLLNVTLQKIQSMASANIETLLETGDCTFMGSGGSSTMISYSFYSQQLSELTLYYYVFGPSDFVDFEAADESVKITACSNPVLGGVAQSDFTLSASLDRFESIPSNLVAGVTSDGAELLIHRNADILGSGQVKISQPLTYWLQFF